MGTPATHTLSLIAIRVGIATGLVIVGDLIGSGEAQERGIVGETPNVARILAGQRRLWPEQLSMYMPIPNLLGMAAQPCALQKPSTTKASDSSSWPMMPFPKPRTQRQNFLQETYEAAAELGQRDRKSRLNRFSRDISIFAWPSFCHRFVRQKSEAIRQSFG